MQAIIYRITPFDAAIGATIKYNWVGNQQFKNRCIIKKNSSNEVVYDNTSDTFKLEHVINLSVASLENGKKYNAYITVFDKDNVESDIQALGSSFMCLKTPEFKFTNITDGQVIFSSSYGFTLNYSQENGELLDSWSISIYNKGHSLLSTSNVQYDTENLTYTFSGFSNKNEYYARGTGQTINGMSLDTGYVGISVTYDIRDVFSLLEPTNLADIGAIHIRSNIISSEGHLHTTPGVYIGNECLDLRNNTLTYSEGFQFADDFSLVCVFYGMEPNQEIIHFYGEDPDVLTGMVIYRTGRFGTGAFQSCFELRIVSCGITSVFYSNKLSLLSPSGVVDLCVSRREGLYNIQIRNHE